MENVDIIKQEDISVPPSELHPPITVIAQGATEAPEKSLSQITKIIVAVHGIGDQNAFGTIQQVVNQFCTFYKEPAAIPLGMFHTNTKQVAFSIPPLFPPKHFKELAFAEVYWAKIPRAVVSDQHTLEEAKAWAATIVERLRLRWKQKHNPSSFKDVDFNRIKIVLLEMINTIAILERLCFLADRAGLFTFDLKKLLDDYLGDVQVVAEFEPSRHDILKTFNEVMSSVHKAHPDAEIHIIAHSEGTVVSFLGLLKAASKLKPAPWLDKVKGFMTFGSPIDKHLVLWPELFPENSTPGKQVKKVPIEWRNYYDKGDPIGFELDDARAWLEENKWHGLFNFTDKDDFGFIRYPFPGKAHVDYWTDEDVFGHFIHTVVKPPLDNQPNFPPPGDKNLNKWLSYILPYIGVFAILLLGVYVLFKGIFSLSPANGDDSNDDFVFVNVLGSAILLSGIMVISRIPRLTRDVWYQLYAFGYFTLTIILYLYLLHSEFAIETWFYKRVGLDIINKLDYGFAYGRIFITLIAISILYFSHRIFPKLGIEPFLILGTIVIVVLTSFYVKDNNSKTDKPLWPLFIATAAFFYLCWLAALIFDLVFVWHVHIRSSFALAKMKTVRPQSTELEMS
ncbi:hypothetical protein [Spirosoma jeollabukense]